MFCCIQLYAYLQDSYVCIILYYDVVFPLIQEFVGECQIRLLNNNQAAQIDSRPIPSVESAMHEFERNGGQLTVFSSFGEDLLQESLTLAAQWETTFYRQHPDFQEFFHTVANVYSVRAFYVL